MSEKAKIACPGPAYIIVPISEDICTRWLFNDIVDHLQDHDVKNLEELNFVNNYMTEFFEFLEHNPEAVATMLPSPEPENRREYRNFHQSIFALMDEPL